MKKVTSVKILHLSPPKKFPKKEKPSIPSENCRNHDWHTGQRSFRVSRRFNKNSILVLMNFQFFRIPFPKIFSLFYLVNRDINIKITHNMLQEKYFRGKINVSSPTLVRSSIPACVCYKLCVNKCQCT